LLAWPKVSLAGGREQILHQRQAVAHQGQAGREVAEDRLVALLGQLRGGGDVDDHRHAMLLANLQRRRGLAAVEGADDHRGTVLDQLLGARAGNVRARFGIGRQQLDPDAHAVADDRRRDLGTALAGLPGLGQQPRARQQHAELERLGLGPDQRRGGQTQCRRRGEIARETPAGEAGGRGHADRASSRARIRPKARGADSSSEGSASATSSASPLRAAVSIRRAI